VLPFATRFAAAVPRIESRVRAGRFALLPLVPLLVLTAASACGGDSKQQKGGRPPVAVLVTSVRRADVPYTIEANGIVAPMASTAVTAQVDGIVQRVSFREGQEVARGQELFAIDARPYQAAYDQARANLARDRATAENARDAYTRTLGLLKDGASTKDVADQARALAGSAEATLLADSAQIQIAKFNLDNTVIRAAITGRTGSVLVMPGNLVRSGGTTPLLVIHQTHPIFVRFSVPAAELRNVLRYGAKGGLPVVAAPTGLLPAPSTDSLVQKPRQSDTAARAQVMPVRNPSSDLARGSLTFVDNAVDTTTGTVTLKAQFPNSDGMLWVGQFVSTSLQLYVEKQALVIPTQAVVTGQRGTYVYVVDDSVKDTLKVRQRPVVIERTAGQLAVIATGLNDGDKIVTDGQSRLTPGATIEIRTGIDQPPGGKRGGKGGKGGKGGGAPAGDSASAGGGGGNKPASAPGDAAAPRATGAPGTAAGAGRRRGAPTP
jgi:multidrug efflux system membrane fusion protein